MSLFFNCVSLAIFDNRHGVCAFSKVVTMSSWTGESNDSSFRYKSSKNERTWCLMSLSSLYPSFTALAHRVAMRGLGSNELTILIISSCLIHLLPQMLSTIPIISVSANLSRVNSKIEL